MAERPNLRPLGTTPGTSTGVVRPGDAARRALGGLKARVATEVFVDRADEHVAIACPICGRWVVGTDEVLAVIDYEHQATNLLHTACVQKLLDARSSEVASAEAFEKYREAILTGE